MKIILKDVELTPVSNVSHTKNQDPISILIEAIGLLSICVGFFTLGNAEVPELGIIIMIGGIIVFGFGYVINLLTIIAKQKYVIKEIDAVTNGVLETNVVNTVSTNVKQLPGENNV